MQHGFLVKAVIFLAVRLKTIEERRGGRGHPLAAAPNDRLSAFAPTSAQRESSSAPAAEEPAIPTPIVSRMKIFACATASALKFSNRVSSAWRAKHSEATGATGTFMRHPERQTWSSYARRACRPHALRSLPPRFGFCIHFWFSVPRKIYRLIDQRRRPPRPRVANSFGRMGIFIPADESRQGHYPCLHSRFR